MMFARVCGCARAGVYHFFLCRSLSLSFSVLASVRPIARSNCQSVFRGRKLTPGLPRDRRNSYPLCYHGSSRHTVRTFFGIAVEVQWTDVIPPHSESTTFRSTLRHGVDSNLCGQSPNDFEPISTTAQTQCHAYRI